MTEPISLSLTEMKTIATAGPSARVVFLCMLVFSLLIVLERQHTYAEVVERDTAGYAVIAHEMLRGRNLYSDLWERKPPLLYATFALAELVCGYGQGEIFFLNITAALATLVALFFAGKGSGGSTIGGLVSAAFWVLIGGDLYLQANQPNAEVFVNACITAAFALLLCWPQRTWLIASILLGALFLSATLYKQHVIIVCVLLAIGHVLQALPIGGIGFRRQLRLRLIDMVVAGCVIVAGWAIVAGYFAAVARFSFFADALFRQNLSYAGHISQNLLTAFSATYLFPHFAPWFAMIALVAICGVYNFKPLSRSVWVDSRGYLWLAWAIGTAIVVALPGKFFAHYFQLWIPLWCVAGGWAAAGLVKNVVGRARFPRYAVLAVIFVCVICTQSSQYRYTADEWTDRQYLDAGFLQQRQMAELLNHLLEPNETFYNLGDDNTLYFVSRRSPPSGLLYVEPLTEGSEIPQYERRLVSDLNRTKPDLILLSVFWRDGVRSRPNLSAWIKQNYVPIRSNFGCAQYRFFVKQHSAMEHRLVNVFHMATTRPL